ncbi:NUDIX domain-containing protein [Anaerocolumna sp. AGMB13020]|uniref:NrtR DNA-binding winged helix domain-containing protein n=1 Tax=Anaerocolumna sp. AGMB13020 TaxID=3081750 RepID=UPI0029556168|nr:NUDIX domain-containing protein [Anaerocolumna sp. AGMB13020]WOO36857.1 NUDIX domain-containing protein [Anaerocolumna sp. AGMB13020]
MNSKELSHESPRDKRGLTEEEFLSAYNPAKYERPSVTVDMLIFTVREREKDNYRKLPEKALSLLLIQRGEHPYLGKWALPGGFVGMEENLEDAALRELEEETGLKDIYLEQLYTWGDVGRDARTRVISTSYMALTDSKSLVPKASDDAAKAAWFTAELKLKEEKKEKYENGYIRKQTYKLILTGEQEILSADYEITKTIGKGTIHTERKLTESDGLAFDHGKIIAYAIDRLRSKVLYTDIAFHLMPDYFTLTELQQVYEVLLDKELLKANFRRKIADMVLETDEYRTDAGHRPSKLYQFKRY